MAKTWCDRVSGRGWRSAAMACCQHTIQQRLPERISPLIGWTAASRRQLPSWQRAASEEKRKRGPPTDRWERGWDGNTNHGEYPSMCQVGINVRISWQALRSLPSHPSSHTNTLLPCLEHMVLQQRHLAALTPGSCASSSPVGSLGTATSSTTCGSSWVKSRAMNYFEAAAANLTSIQEIHCKYMTASQNTCHPHTNASLTTWLVVHAKGLVVLMWWHGSFEVKDVGCSVMILEVLHLRQTQLPWKRPPEEKKPRDKWKFLVYKKHFSKFKSMNVNKRQT